MNLNRQLDEARQQAEQEGDRSRIATIDEAMDTLLAEDRITPDTLIALDFADPR